MQALRYSITLTISVLRYRLAFNGTLLYRFETGRRFALSIARYSDILLTSSRTTRPEKDRDESANNSRLQSVTISVITRRD